MSASCTSFPRSPIAPLHAVVASRAAGTSTQGNEDFAGPEPLKILAGFPPGAHPPAGKLQTAPEHEADTVIKS